MVITEAYDFKYSYLVTNIDVALNFGFSILLERLIALRVCALDVSFINSTYQLNEKNDLWIFNR